METTPNYNLKKPGDEDFYNIEDFNDNVDVIDAELKRLNDAIGDLDADNITLPDGKTLTEKFDEIVSEVGELEELGTDTKSNVIAAINEIHQALVAHKADYTKQIPYAITSGSVNAYTVSTNPALSELVAGAAITVKIHAQNTGASTLNWDSKGAKSIKNPDGSDVSAGDLALNGVYTLRYDGSNFILQGKGEVKLTGDFVAGDLLAGKTGYSNNPKNKITGTMPNNGSQSATLTINGSGKPTKSIPAGYTTGGTVTAELDSSLASKILSGNTIGGVAGTAIGLSSLTAGYYAVGQVDDITYLVNSGEGYKRFTGFTIKLGGTVRISFTGSTSGWGYSYTINFRIYKNGSPVGTERSLVGGQINAMTTWSEDFTVNAGDRFDIYVKSSVSLDNNVTLSNILIQQSVRDLFITKV